LHEGAKTRRREERKDEEDRKKGERQKENVNRKKTGSDLGIARGAVRSWLWT
jgi:hypothetical protein